jgi:hypothetical protein
MGHAPSKPMVGDRWCACYRIRTSLSTVSTVTLILSSPSLTTSCLVLGGISEHHPISLPCFPFVSVHDRVPLSDHHFAFLLVHHSFSFPYRRFLLPPNFLLGVSCRGILSHVFVLALTTILLLLFRSHRARKEGLNRLSYLCCFAPQ